jgi:hypothetical protein
LQPFPIFHAGQQTGRDNISECTAQVCCGNKAGITIACNHLPFSMLHSGKEATAIPLQQQDWKDEKPDCSFSSSQ